MKGIDYAYTLQGWLKGINSTAVRVYDMGADGRAYSGPAAYAFALGLYYFNKQGTDVAGSPYNKAAYPGSEYIPIWIPVADPLLPLPVADTSFKPLYNGNIAAATVNVPVLGNALLYNYRYDQLNRLTGMQAYTGINNASGDFTPVAVSDYKENVGYDPNGNILGYVRYGNPAGGTLKNTVKGFGQWLFAYICKGAEVL